MSPPCGRRRTAHRHGRPCEPSRCGLCGGPHRPLEDRRPRSPSAVPLTEVQAAGASIGIAAGRAVFPSAEVARAEFHRAVRRLHLTGVSLRELAAALGLSHQRVHQIVEAAGGARRWRPQERRPDELACSFCARPQRRTRRLVAGPGVYICGRCVALAETVIRFRTHRRNHARSSPARTRWCAASAVQLPR
jgi:hypothetical protein